MKILNIFYNIGLFILVLIAGLSAITLLGLPNGYKLFVIQSGSMEPAIKTGAVVIVSPSNDYNKDEVITFKNNPAANINNSKALITHRITEISKNINTTSYTTKGDANKAEDLEKVPKSSVTGKVIFSIPYLGYPINFAKTQTGFVLLIVIPATIIVYSELMSIKNEAIRLIKERKNRKLSMKEKIEEKIGEKIIDIEKEITKVL